MSSTLRQPAGRPAVAGKRAAAVEAAASRVSIFTLRNVACNREINFHRIGVRKFIMQRPVCQTIDVMAQVTCGGDATRTCSVGTRTLG